MTEWPAYIVERWPIERLKRNERNAKRHPKEQIEQIRALMREFGWTIPVLVGEDDVLIAGHGRLEAALAEGYSEAPVIVAHGWSKAQCRAYAIADNRVAERGAWDRDILRLELGELHELGFDLSPIGFDIAKLESKDADTSSKLAGLKYSVIVDCRDELHQIEVVGQFEADGFTCRPVVS